MLKKIIALVLNISSVSLAQELDQVPGLIPLNPYRSAASDLEFEGQLLSVLAAEELKKNGTDLSELNPQRSDLWRSEGFPAPASEALSPSPLTFVATKDSRPGNFRFVARDPQTGDESTFFVSKNSSNLLLRAALLQRLGYRVAAARRYASLHLQFANRLEKDAFLSRLAAGTLGATTRWVVNQEGQTVHLQDVIAVQETEFYNLAYGSVPASVVQGRRTLNALLIPFGLVDVPESVNLWKWDCGVRLSQYVQISYGESASFNMSLEDAQWILKKIAQLTRQDFLAIVQSADMPASVGALALEKLISRRNSLMNLFGINSPELPFTPGGKIEHQDWPGYGARFTYGDIQSPVRSEEIRSLLWGRLQSELMANAMTDLSQRFLVNTDIAAELEKLQHERINKLFESYMETGEIQEQGLGILTVPYVNARIILQRNLLIGRFIGTDFMVNLSDTFGFSVGTGIYGQVTGLPAGIGGGGGAQLFFTRFFSHIRPVQSVKQALKTPYKNLFVPATMMSFAKTISAIQSKDDAYFASVEGKDALRLFSSEFSKQIGVGESLVVSDTVGAGVEGNLQGRFAEVLVAQASFNARQVVLRRTHIYRASNEQVLVFEDQGQALSLTPGLSLSAHRIPIFQFSLSRQKGSADIVVHELNLQLDLKSNTQLLPNLALLASLLRGEHPELLKERVTVSLRHEMKSRVFRTGLFIFSSRAQKLDDRLTATHPSGAKKEFFRHDSVQLTGLDYENFLLGAANAAIFKHMGGEYRLESGQPLDPSTTIGGSARVQGASVEVELQSSTENAVLTLIEEHRGWKISRKDLDRQIKLINAEVGRVLFPHTFLGSTKAVELYQLALKVGIYQEGQKNLVRISQSDLKKILLKHGTFYFSLPGRTSVPEHINNVVGILTTQQKELRQSLESGDQVEAARRLCALAAYLKSQVSWAGIVQAVGGEANLYGQSRLAGYRINDEGTDQGIQSHSFGVIGQKQADGPMRSFMQRYRLPASESQALWLMERI